MHVLLDLESVLNENAERPLGIKRVGLIEVNEHGGMRLSTRSYYLASYFRVNRIKQLEFLKAT